ncbi:response regulator transcription factor [Microbacterium resistens]|uniref:response regulator transcription factor n=1 Tax=Microbacterium resistens TaxID=156977 RepID=UPI001C58B933|nr:response regulator transcription factor [Microbacterium resistens]MBW1640139.1 response regulator transcription factor [Microbacterium resistens]
MTVRVLLADDQDLLREALALMLARDERIEIVGSVRSGDEAIALADERVVDVVLMDVRMPGTDGIAATAEVRRRHPGVRVLVLTTFDLDEYAVGAIRAGASGFLTKDAAPQEVADAVVAVAAGERVVGERALEALVGFVRSAVAPRDPDASAALTTLTPREQEVVRLLAAGRSNDEIAQRLFLSPNTVKTHVKAVLAKLALPDRIHVVIWAYENGVLRPAAEQDHPRG